MSAGRSLGAASIFAEEDGAHAEITAQGFFEEVLALDAENAVGGAGGFEEGGAQLLDALVFAACDEG